MGWHSARTCLFLGVTLLPAGASLGDGVNQDDPPAPSRSALSRELEQLRAERQALRSAWERAIEARAIEEQSEVRNRAETVRVRIEELIRKMNPPPEPADDGEAKGQDPAVTDAPNPSIKPERPQPVAMLTTGPVDPMAMAEALFRAGEFQASLEAYQGIDLKDLKAGDRVAVQYLMATCLRRMNKAHEAAALYREVANSKGDDQLVECARWQLSTIEWRGAVRGRLEQLRARRVALNRPAE